MTKFFNAIEKKDFQAITRLLENGEIDIDENLAVEDSQRKAPRKALHCLEYAIGNPGLFVFLLGSGANPLCSITAIIKDLAYLESILTLAGAGLTSPLFPFVAKRLSSLRGKEKTQLHRLLLKYDFPVPRDGEWCNQTREECIANGNMIGLSRGE